ncbi:MAG: phenylalanine 4-monooxygenase [Wenzhouxiangellaceae bacterium]|nr:phenylalanine 4-monooxygenase [Wenzhouxiangellaceae bacterium]
MASSSRYEAKLPDADGNIPYTDEEHAVWADLYARQREIIDGRVCDAFINGLNTLNLPADRIPQPSEVSAVLIETTGWQVEPVPALINFDRFFQLLSEKRFPAASFIRTREDMDYLQEPDIFHEIFGHTAMLTHPAFADFTAAYGKAGVNASKEERVYLARLYWFTVEFGLLNTADGVRIYGGGIASSPGETVFSVESDEPIRRPFDPVDALRTPYRIDIYQSVYYVLDRLDDLFELAETDLLALIRKARALGEFAPTFPPKHKEAA